MRDLLVRLAANVRAVVLFMGVKRIQAVGGALGPEQRLADGEGAGEVRGDGYCVELAPEVDVLGAVVGAAGEEERGARAGQLGEVIGIGHVAPLLRDAR